MQQKIMATTAPNASIERITRQGTAMSFQIPQSAVPRGGIGISVCQEGFWELGERLARPYELFNIFEKKVKLTCNEATETQARAREGFG